MGQYVSRISTAPLAVHGRRGRPQLVHPDWPIKVKDGATDITEATFMVSIARREEKGSDVNVASHLLIDLLDQSIDAAVVISNDSDLAYPIEHARKRIPVGMVNPTKGFPAGKLAGDPNDGAGGHWWARLTAEDLYAAQLPTRIAHIHKPAPW